MNMNTTTKTRSVDLDELEIAIVHKHYPERGGAERVADELARTFDAPVYTAYDSAASADDVTTIELFGESRLRWLWERGVMLGWLSRDAYYYLSYDHVEALHDYDVVIQSGTAPAWYVPPDDQVVVRYVHSPPRTPYDLFRDAGRDDPVARWYSRAVRLLYPSTTSYADQHIANSELVARRLEKYLGVGDARVIYPPVDVDGLQHRGCEDYYLALSRLAPGKEFGEVIDAFDRPDHRDKQLLIAGDGPQRAQLDARADGVPNVDLLGYVSESTKADLLGRAKALVFNARNEDFGMVPVEAFAAGTPVIGVDEGFTRHQIRDGHAGIVYSRGVSELAAAVSRFEREGVSASPRELARVADQCSRDRFRDELRAVVRETVARATITPKLWGGLAQAGRGPHHTIPRRKTPPGVRSPAVTDGGGDDG